MSSGLNSLAAVFLTDFLHLGCKVELSEGVKTIITKIVTFVFGLISFLVVFILKYLPGVLYAAIQLFGMLGGPILGIFSLGMFVPFASSAGALTGLVISLIFSFWIGFGQSVARQMGTMNSKFSPMPNSTISHCPSSWTENQTEATLDVISSEDSSNFVHLPLYDVSYMWYGPITFLICILVGTLVSLARPADHRKLDKRLISPTAPNLFFWIPNFSWLSQNKSLQLRTHLKNYYSQVGSQHPSVSERSSKNDVFGMNGAINVAFVQTDTSPINTDSTYM